MHSWFQLRKVEEVAPVDGKVFDLLGGEHSLHRGLLRVHRNLLALHFDDLRRLSDLEFDVARGRYTHLHRHAHF